MVCLGALLFLAPTPRTRGRLDTLGAALSVLGLGLLAFGLVGGRTYGWLSIIEPLRLPGLTWDRGPSPVLAAFVLAAVTLAGFAFRQAAITRGDNPDRALMDVRLLAIPSFRNGNIATLINGALTSQGLPAAQSGQLTRAVTDSAGAAIKSLAASSQTASAADAARSAMAQGITLAAFVAAGFVVLGLIATTLIPAARATEAEPETVSREPVIS